MTTGIIPIEEPCEICDCECEGGCVCEENECLDCGCGEEPDDDPPDATNPYAKPYDDALAGHLRNWEPKIR